MSESGAAKAVRWDTYTNRIIFNIEKDSLDGRLVLRRTPDGRIDISLVKNHDGLPEGVRAARGIIK
jgi:hypothetical protein